MAPGGRLRASSGRALSFGPCWLSLLLLLAAAVAGAEEPRPRLGSVVAEAQVEPGQPLLVTMDYFLHPEGAESVPFTALELDGTRAANVRAFVGERELSFKTASSTREPGQSRLEGHVDLPAALGRRERFHLRLRYEVLPRPPAVGREATLLLPLLVAGWAPDATGPATFVANVRLPRSLRILDSFPSEFETLESVDRSRTTESYRFSLPVVPALLRLRAGGDQAPGLTAVKALDVGAALVLVGLALYGWRRVREHLP